MRVIMYVIMRVAVVTGDAVVADIISQDITICSCPLADIILQEVFLCLILVLKT